MDDQLKVELAKISGPKMGGKIMAFFAILKKWPEAKDIADYFGNSQQYTQTYVRQNPQNRSARLIRSGILRQTETLLERAMGGAFSDGGALTVKFNHINAKSREALAQALWTRLLEWDPKLKAKENAKRQAQKESDEEQVPHIDFGGSSPSKPAMPKSEKPSPATTSVIPTQVQMANPRHQTNPRIQLKRQNTTPRKPHRTPQQAVRQQQEHLATNSPEQLSKHALQFLNSTDGQLKQDDSFRDHPFVFPWSNDLGADKAVNKSMMTTQVGKIRGYVLDGTSSNFLNWLKGQFSLNEVLSPHALELAFNSKNGLQKVPRGVQVEAMYLIARFSVENDWPGLAAVFHGRYATEYALRRQQGWGKLSVANTSDGIAKNLLTGDFDRRIKSIFVETAFWYYLTRWAYSKVDTSQRKDGAYLKRDEGNFSAEARRILSTIRQDSGSSQIVKGQNNDLQIQSTLRRILNSEQDLRGLLGVLLAHELLVYASDPKNGNFHQQLVDKAGKVTSGTQQTISHYLTQDAVMSQFDRIIQQAVPELGKRISEYQRGEDPR